MDASMDGGHTGEVLAMDASMDGRHIGEAVKVDASMDGGHSGEAVVVNASMDCGHTGEAVAVDASMDGSNRQFCSKFINKLQLLLYIIVLLLLEIPSGKKRKCENFQIDECCTVNRYCERGQGREVNIVKYGPVT